MFSSTLRLYSLQRYSDINSAIQNRGVNDGSWKYFFLSGLESFKAFNSFCSCFMYVKELSDEENRLRIMFDFPFSLISFAVAMTENCTSPLGQCWYVTRATLLYFPGFYFAKRFKESGAILVFVGLVFNLVVIHLF